MKKQEKDALRKKSLAELKKSLIKAKKELVTLQTGRETQKNFKLVGRKRQEIAVTYTMMREKEFKEGAK